MECFTLQDVSKMWTLFQASFTRDTEHLATSQCKEWNTHLSMRVFTLLASISIQICFRPLWTGPQGEMNCELRWCNFVLQICNASGVFAFGSVDIWLNIQSFQTFTCFVYKGHILCNGVCGPRGCINGVAFWSHVSSSLTQLCCAAFARKQCTGKIICANVLAVLF